jgi:hypothetical protein
MQTNRRGLLKLAGAGTVVAAGVAIPTTLSRRSPDQTEVFRFRATLGLPEAPLPSYATFVVEGTVDLVKGTGRVASRMLAGHPDASSTIGLPGFGRIITVTGVDKRGTQLNIRGMIEDRSQLEPGESHQVEIVIDQDRGVVQAPLGSKSVVLGLA